MGLGWAEGTIVSRRSMAWIHGFMLIRGQVEISVIHNPIKARSVSVTPLTSDDWEILVGQFNRRGGHNLIMEQEQHASFLENNLLSQLRGAQKGQVLDVWVMGRTKIRIRVGQFSPCYSVIELTHKVQDATDPKTSDSSAVLVHSETEIFVAPRPRDAAPRRAAEIEESVIPAASSSSSTKPDATHGKKAKEQHVRLRLLPPRVASEWGRPEIPQDQLDTLGSDRLALCSPETLRRVKRKLEIKGDGLAHVRLELVRRASKDSSSQSQMDAKADAGEAKAKEEDDRLEVWLASWLEMPEGCLALLGKTDDKWECWGSVRFVFSARSGAF